MMERRTIASIQTRAVEMRDGSRGVELQCIKPGVVDDYGSLWNARAFDESLKARLPVLCWAHDWSNPLGPGVSYTTSAQGPRVRFKFSDFEAVPDAKRAYAQVQDGTIRDCSVGFSNALKRPPTTAEERRYPGVREVIEKATLDEVSLVIRGAVPGAEVLSVRSARREAAVRRITPRPSPETRRLARMLSDGTITERQWRAGMRIEAEVQEALDLVRDAELRSVDQIVAQVAKDITSRARQPRSGWWS